MKEKVKLLGLKKGEMKIILALEIPKTLHDLCKNLNIPKSTIADSLKRLERRGLVQKTKFIYLQSEQFKKIISGNELSITDYSKIIINRGLNEILKTWGILYSFRNYRCIMYQSNESVRYFLQKIKLEDLIKHNEKVKNNNQTLEMYVEPGYLDNIKKVLEREQYIKWLQSFQRNFICYEIYRDVFYSKNDIIIFMDNVFFTNNSDEVSIQIRQYDTVKTIKDLLESLQNKARRINFSEEIKRELSTLKN